MPWRFAAVCTFLAMLAATPAHAMGGEQSSEPSLPFSVHLGAGAHLNEGGNLQSLSFGYTPWRGVTFLVNVERDHVPTKVTTYPDGFAASRGGTLTTAGAELRYTAPIGRRVSPYVMTGGAAGVSRPNVNDIFPNRVSNLARMMYAGGGVRIPVRPHLDVFADARFMLWIERDSVGGLLPIRGGVTWRF
jgi:hypothetical protein